MRTGGELADKAGATAAERAGGKTDTASGAKVGGGLKLAFGLGGVAFGVKDAGFNFFLLLFYSQVMGLDARMVGLALTIALALDAISDPLVGYWSDHHRSRMGRRHPFMYLSAIPVAVCYFMMWRPPVGLDANGLFLWVLALAILTRTCITFFETPSNALCPELTPDYDQRSSLMSARTFWGWAGGNAMTVMMFFFLFPAFTTPDKPAGFSREPYGVYAYVASALILLSIVASSWGTQRAAQKFRTPPKREGGSVLSAFREIAQTLGQRSFFALFVAAVFGSVILGLTNALSVYFSTYFWGFTPVQIGGLTLAIFISALLGSLLASGLTRRIGKKSGAIWIGLIATAVSPIPIMLRLTGVLPKGDPATFWTVFCFGQVEVILNVCLQALAYSMMSDLVEPAEARTGKRLEGVFFAVNTFVAKLVTGVGLMVATVVLTLAHFPAGADPSQVGEEPLMRLGLYYLPILVVLRLAMVGALATYTIDRSTHEANLQAARAARKADPA